MDQRGEVREGGVAAVRGRLDYGAFERSDRVNITALALPEVKVLSPQRHSDARGFFSETYNRRALAAHGIDVEFVQDNHSLSRDVGVLRGLHFQIAPRAQAKLLRVVRGRIFDVVVDLRRSSPRYGRWASVEISADAWNQLFVPIGFAHGFMTLEPDCEVMYKVSDYYSRDDERGIAWDDPHLRIEWPLTSGRAPTLSERDRALPRLDALPTYFE